jgi:flagellar assembly protein FliH
VRGKYSSRGEVQKIPLSDNIIKAKDIRVVKIEPGAPRKTGLNTATGGMADKQWPPSDGEKERMDSPQLIDKVKKEAYEKGFAEGVGFKKKEMEAALHAISVVLSEVKQLKKDFYAGIEDEMLKLALSVARKVINMEISSNRQVVLAVLNKATRKISEANGLKIFLNPDDLSFIMGMKEELFRENTLLRDAVFESSPGVERGGVLLETDKYEVDARLDEQFKIIKGALAKG